MPRPRHTASNRPHPLTALLGATLLTLVGCASTPASLERTGPDAEPRPAEAASFDTELAVRTFDEAWRIVRDTHFDPELGGIDWNAVRDELRPQAESSTSVHELRGVITAMVGRLGLSHYTIIPGDLRSAPVDSEPIADPSPTHHGDADEASGRPDPTPETGGRREPGTVGMAVRLVEGRVVVTSVTPDGPADRAGVRTGWVVDRIGRRGVSSILGDLENPAPDSGAAPDGWGEFVTVSIIGEMLARPVGRSVRLELLDGADRRVELELESVARPGETVELGPLRLSAEFSSRPVTGGEWRDALDGASVPPTTDRTTGESPNDTTADAVPRVGLIAFSTWIVPIAAPFHRAVDEFRGGDGMVIDLRGNPGGIGGLVMGIGGHFVDEPMSLGTLRNRHGSLEFRTNPRRTDSTGRLVEPFAGPVAILVDGLSGSTSEIFAGGMQSIGRARVFGSTTAGQALPAVMSELPNGDSLMHAIADYILPDGTRLEGRGVIPDEPIRLTREDLLAGRDPALLAALRWIAKDGTTAATADARPPVRNRPTLVGKFGPERATMPDAVRRGPKLGSTPQIPTPTHER